MQKLLKVNELSEHLGLSRASIYRLKDKGMPFLKLGSSIRFDLEEVNKWIREQNKDTE